MAKKNSEELAPFTLTPEEMAAVMAARDKVGGGAISIDAQQQLANALITAIEATRPPSKKTPFNRPKGGPWEPKDGTKKPRLKRTMFQHGIELTEANLSPEEIELLSKIKAGSYCGGHVRVIKRRDKSLDIDYPVRTASQRLKLVNSFGVTSFASLLRRLIDEATNKQKYADPDDLDE